VDPLIRVGTGLGLTEEEKQDIIAFLKTLTDPSFIQNPDFKNPHE
jgi:cytochrome c peroxidase